MYGYVIRQFSKHKRLLERVICKQIDSTNYTINDFEKIRQFIHFANR